MYILQQSFNRDCSLNVYSGHDYSILCVLGSLNIARKISKASHFGSYLIFELWDRAGNKEEYSLHNRDIVNQGVEGDMGTVDHIQESCSVVGVGVGDSYVSDTRVHIQSGAAPFRCLVNDNDGDSDSNNTLCSYDDTPNEITDVTACDVTSSKYSDEKIQKSDQLQNLLGQPDNNVKLKNPFLQTDCGEVEDRRFLRISANFSPFEASDNTIMNRLNDEVNEKSIILLGELSIQEIKQKHDFLFQSLSSRGYFVPQVTTSQR